MPEPIIWNILIIDDQADICEQVKNYLEVQKGENEFVVNVSQNFANTLSELRNKVYDLLILDVRLGSTEGSLAEEAGADTLKAIKKNRFIPVIFYTALPHLVRDTSTPPVWVVQKDAGLPVLLATINNAINTKLPLINRVMLHQFEQVQRDYMWGFVSENWKSIGESEDKISLAYFLARRMALSLSGSGISEMARELGDDGKGIFTEDPVHPLRYYIIPPIDPIPSNGDVYFQKEYKKYWILLTPACDLIPHNGKPPKAENIVMAECLLLEDQKEFKEWRDDKSKIDNLKKILGNNRGSGLQPDRFYFLPGSINIPNLVTDFQKLVSISLADLKDYDRIATLDSPYGEALLSKFSRYFGRIGTPDLNHEIVIKSLK